MPVRLHSACLTGDLFGSLKCDCGDQLRETVQWMAENGGGVLLYLDQEGRGNGISNKMRAYKLQEEGADTVEANEMLGLAAELRDFTGAAAVLHGAGISTLRLLTNNPAKVEVLAAAGLTVQQVPSTGIVREHNERYLRTKRDKMRHMLDHLTLTEAVTTATANPQYPSEQITTNEEQGEK